MKIKKLITLFLCAVCLTACAQIPPVKDTVPPEQQKTIAPPEDGWTAEELMSVSYINDYSLSYPLTLESFGGGVSFSSINFYSDEAEEGELWYTMICNNVNVDSENASFAAVSYGRSEDNATAGEPVAKLQTFSDFASFNGVRHDLPEEDIEKLLGKPDRIIELDNNFIEYVYCDKESGKELINVCVLKDRTAADNNRVTRVRITF